MEFVNELRQSTQSLAYPQSALAVGTSAYKMFLDNADLSRIMGQEIPCSGADFKCDFSIFAMPIIQHDALALNHCIIAFSLPCSLQDLERTQWKKKPIHEVLGATRYSGIM
jgi:hypothetical protein